MVLDITSDRYRDLLTATESASGVGVPAANADSLVLLLFTSGTTGLSKAVRCT